MSLKMLILYQFLKASPRCLYKLIQISVGKIGIELSLAILKPNKNYAARNPHDVYTGNLILEV